MKSGFASDGLPAYLAKFNLLTSIKGPPGSVIIDAYKKEIRILILDSQALMTCRTLFLVVQVSNNNMGKICHLGLDH